MGTCHSGTALLNGALFNIFRGPNTSAQSSHPPEGMLSQAPHEGFSFGQPYCTREISKPGHGDLFWRLARACRQTPGLGEA